MVHKRHGRVVDWPHSRLSLARVERLGPSLEADVVDPNSLFHCNVGHHVLGCTVIVVAEMTSIHRDSVAVGLHVDRDVEMLALVEGEAAMAFLCAP